MIGLRLPAVVLVASIALLVLFALTVQTLSATGGR
jgi:hypothetical protein